MERFCNLIGGEMAGPVGGAYLPTYEPASGRIYAEAPDSDERDIECAVAAAQKAFPTWSRTPAEDRCAALSRLGDLIARDLEPLARAESVDTGKPLAMARAVDIPRAARNFHFFASAIVHFSSEAHPVDDTALNYTLRDPLGVVGAISPWNLPLYLLSWKVAPAIAAGNCVVAKPSELTPATASWLGRLSVEAGLPAGVLNIVHGVGAKAGAALTAHPDVRALSFTGGTKTGAEVGRMASARFKKVALELGGKNPTIVFADADFDLSLEASVRAAFSNQGEICLCGSRILVEKSLYARFRDAFVARTRMLRVGDPLHVTSDLGALISQAHLDKVVSYMRLAVEEGGKILSGGKTMTPGGRCQGGWFAEPTVIEGLALRCRTNQEEIFGPVVTLAPFDDETDALALANGTLYGLCASVWTSNLSRAHRVAAGIHAGVVWVNCWMLRDLRTPFGGVKQSGVGKEGGIEALRFFTEAKNICVKI